MKALVNELKTISENGNFDEFEHFSQIETLIYDTKETYLDSE